MPLYVTRSSQTIRLLDGVVLRAVRCETVSSYGILRNMVVATSSFVSHRESNAQYARPKSTLHLMTCSHIQMVVHSMLQC